MIKYLEMIYSSVLVTISLIICGILLKNSGSSIEVNHKNSMRKKYPTDQLPFRL